MNNTHVFNVSGQCMLTLVTTFFGYMLIGTVTISKYDSRSSVGPSGSMTYAVGLPNNSYKPIYHQYGVGSRPAL